MFKIKNCRYKDILNIEEINFTKGKVNFLTGPSGSGKSTLLKLMVKIYSLNEGLITYCGQNINYMQGIEIRRKCLLISQNPIFFEGDVKYNLLFPLKIQGLEIPSDGMLKELLIKYNVDKLLTDQIRDFSGGEKKRISLIRGELIDCETYLLDEPSVGLDMENWIKSMENIFGFIKSRKKNIVVVSHDENLKNIYCENEIILDKVKVIHDN